MMQPKSVYARGRSGEGSWWAVKTDVRTPSQRPVPVPDSAVVARCCVRAPPRPSWWPMSTGCRWSTFRCLRRADRPGRSRPCRRRSRPAARFCRRQCPSTAGEVGHASVDWPPPTNSSLDSCPTSTPESVQHPRLDTECYRYWRIVLGRLVDCQQPATVPCWARSSPGRLHTGLMRLRAPCCWAAAVWHACGDCETSWRPSSRRRRCQLQASRWPPGLGTGRRRTPAAAPSSGLRWKTDEASFVRRAPTNHWPTPIPSHCSTFSCDL